MIWKDKARFFITVSGVGFTVLLMLFLVGIYEGVKRGSTNYVHTTQAEIWVCQQNSTNLLRSSSFLPALVENDIKNVKGVGNVTSIIRIIATALINNRSVTLFIFGFDSKSPIGGPTTLSQGTLTIDSNEIILDKAFAAKHRLSMGDVIVIQGHDFRVSGISLGTNALVAQFAFTSLKDAQRLIELSNIISFCLVNPDSLTNTQQLVDTLKQQFPSLAVFSKKEFINNNLEEMQTGVLPVLWTIAFFGMLVGTVVITLMLYGSILERREEYALIKAIGARRKFLISLVINQSLIGSLVGFILGFLLNIILTPLLTKSVPEISLILTWQSVSAIFIASLAIGVIGSIVPVLKLSRIYPAEVFRA